MIVAVFVTMASGVVLALEVFLPMPLELVAGSLVAWLAGLIAIGLLAFREARRTGIGFGRSLGRGLRLFGRALIELMP